MVRVAAELAARLKSDALREAFPDYGRQLLTRKVAPIVVKQLKRDIAFVRHLDDHYPELPEATTRVLFATFKRRGLKKTHQLVLNFLVSRGLLPSFHLSDIDDLHDESLQNAIVSRAIGMWYHTLLSDYLEELRRSYRFQLRHDIPASQTTLTSAMKAAHSLVAYATEHQAATSHTALRTDTILAFLDQKPGYRNPLRRFVDFLNTRRHRFGNEKILLKTRRNEDNRALLPTSHQAALYQRWITATGKDTKKALAGILMMLYAQPGRRLVTLKASDIRKTGDHRYLIQFARLPLPLTGSAAEVMDQYLQWRTSNLERRQDIDNPWLFHSWRYQQPLSPSSITGYLKEWGVTADQLYQCALRGIIDAGENDPSILRDGYGIHNVTASSYLLTGGRLKSY
ncbi:hypothetical protein [Spongiibacter tropicus]|uniref:hypothetical protein n=1 Tax=Spongiibacter tropicus TaxID=454602 RepID=UPI0035BE58D3